MKFNDDGTLGPKMCMKGIAELVTGSGAKKARAAQSAALAEQRRTRLAQEAAQNRQQIKLDDQEADLQKDVASQRRAVVARRTGRGALSFTPQGGLKTRFGE